MASSLDRSTREANHKQKEDAIKKREGRKIRLPQTKLFGNDDTPRNRRVTAASFETRSMIRTMVISAGILLIAFLFFELLLLGWKWVLPKDVDFTREDTYWHLINIADTCIGFLIGLTAMDALNYINQNQRNKREEQRAIIRHNRIVKPCIDMYLARKNSLITPDGTPIQQFKVITTATIRDLKDMYGPSSIISDAGKIKIDAFEFYLKKLQNAFLNMAEDINFDYNPELCDAVMKFLNETIYGQAAMEAVASYGREGNRSTKMQLIRKMKEIPDSTEISDVDGELNTVLIFVRMIHAHEDALEKYLEYVNKIDSESKKRAKKIQ